MKKAISLILSVIMLFSVTAGMDLYALAKENTTVYSDFTNAAAGETIRVPVAIKNNTSAGN